MAYRKTGSKSNLFRLFYVLFDFHSLFYLFFVLVRNSLMECWKLNQVLKKN